jgi:tetratricopeptide (TPR) repeat protein
VVPLLVAVTASTGAHADTRTPGAGKWLIDLGRHYGASRQAAPHRADGLHVLALMRAAARVEPDSAEAYYWQYDLLSRLGRDEQALAALDNYVRLEPSDSVARLRWAELTVEQGQTVQDRVARCRKMLDRPGQDDLVRSDLHRLLADLSYRSGREDLALEHVQEALKLCPRNIAARNLAWQLDADSPDHAGQVSLLLELISAAPVQLDLIWQLGQLLDDLSLHAQAQKWYEYALAVHVKAHPGQPRPPRYLFDLARSLADAGQLRRAEQICQEALEYRPGYNRVRLLLFHLAEKLGQKTLAREQLDVIDGRYQSLLAEVTQQRNWQKAIWMAWFYSIYKPQPQLALKLAEMAVESSGRQPEALRSLGFAALAAAEHDRAIEVLAPLAKLDQTAGLGLGKAYLAKGQAAKGLAALEAAARLRYSGIIFEQIADLLTQHDRLVPQAPGRSAIVKLLDSVDPAVLKFWQEPQRFFKLEVEPAGPSSKLALIGPWRLRLTLHNVGALPLTLGPELMVNPVAVISATAKARQEQKFENYCMVWLNRKPFLDPGEAITVTQSIDIGPLRTALARAPQLEHRLSVNVLLGPTADQTGAWQRGIAAMQVGPVELIRPKVVATPQQVDALIADSAAPNPRDRCRAIDTLALLLAEAQLMAAGKVDYPAIPVDSAAIKVAMLTGLEDQHRLVRAHALAGLQLCKLDNKMIGRAAATLSDKHWLVRMMAVRLFAEAQERKFAPVIERLANSDPDELVQLLARSYRLRWFGQEY